MIPGGRLRAASVGAESLRIVDQLPGNVRRGARDGADQQAKPARGRLCGGHDRRPRTPARKDQCELGRSRSGRVRAAPSGLLGGSRLSREEVLLIESFLQRRDSLDYIVRGRMGHQLAERFMAVLHVTMEQRVAAAAGGDETFLEMLARRPRRQFLLIPGKARPPENLTCGPRPLATATRIRGCARKFA